MVLFVSKMAFIIGISRCTHLGAYATHRYAIALAHHVVHGITEVNASHDNHAIDLICNVMQLYKRHVERPLRQPTVQSRTRRSNSRQNEDRNHKKAPAGQNEKMQM